MKKVNKLVLLLIVLCLLVFVLVSLYRSLFVRTVKIFKVYRVEHTKPVSKDRYKTKMVIDDSNLNAFECTVKFLKKNYNAEITNLPTNIDFKKFSIYRSYGRKIKSISYDKLFIDGVDKSKPELNPDWYIFEPTLYTNVIFIHVGDKIECR